MIHFGEWVPACQVRSQRRQQLAAIGLSILIAIALLCGLASFAHSAERDASCWLGGCSGVCVDPAGLVLTVKHCEFGDQVDVEFRAIGKTYKGQKVYTGSYEDDVVAFRLPAGIYPFAPIAKEAPKRGEIVYSFGYPAGKFEALTGTVIGNAQYQDGTPVIATTIPARGGHSGGPLFNLAGEVVALCSTSLTAKAPQRVEMAGDSNWIATGRVALAVLTAQVNQRPPLAAPGPPPSTPRRLYVFTAIWCGSCQTFHSDYGRNIGGLQDFMQAQGIERTKGGKHYGAVESIPLGWDHPEIARACEVATGSKPRTLPTFWLDGAKDVLVGYAGPEKLKSYIASQIVAASPPAETPPIEQTPFQREEPPPAPQTPIQPDPRITDPPQTPDPGSWSDVKVAVLVAKQDRGVAFGIGARLALEQLGSTIRRKVQESTQGRADVELVSERLSPERFAAAKAATGLTVDKVHVVVLVRQQDLAGVRAKAAEMVQKAVASFTERAEHVPIDFVSERINPELYSAVMTSLNAPDSVPAEEPATSWFYSAIAAVAGLFKRRFLNLKEAP